MKSHAQDSKSFDLYNKKLGRVPASVWQSTNLERLNLADNHLSLISEEIGKLPAAGVSPIWARVVLT